MKVLKEQETRRKLIEYCRLLGCEQELLAILKKYDSLQKNCRDEKERKDIAKLGIFEIFSLLGKGKELRIDGELVYKED
ncbi:MAG: hypothetical protein LC122_13100 [Chitinophagales bacterium]|nr:hypothetical protein [Chitinophagales bacterium]